jgi:uncharacterized protein
MGLSLARDRDHAPVGRVRCSPWTPLLFPIELHGAPNELGERRRTGLFARTDHGVTEVLPGPFEEMVRVGQVRSPPEPHPNVPREATDDPDDVSACIPGHPPLPLDREPPGVLLHDRLHDRLDVARGLLGRGGVRSERPAGHGCGSRPLGYIPSDARAPPKRRVGTVPGAGPAPPAEVRDRVSRKAEATLRPVPDTPALLIEPEDRTRPRTLVVADVHLGLGSTPARPAGPPEATAPALAEELARILRASGADRILIAGDAKHPIVGTPPPLRPVVFDFFARLLEEGGEVELVLGNHDVGIVRHLPREVEVRPASGIVRDGVGVFHGHRWPSNPVLRASRLVVGHLHPGFRLAPTADDPAGKRRCWVRAELPPPPPNSKRRRRHVELRAREIVVLPAFNPIAGTEALNRDRPARGRSFLYQRFLARGTPRAYLLDGTDLGPLPTRLRAEANREGAERVPPGQ